MSKFKVGDKVRMSDGGMGKWPDSDVNPHKKVGIVSDIAVKSMVGLNVQVDWGGSKNTYAPSHLESIAPTNTLTPGQTYTSANGEGWECLAIRGNTAWMARKYDGGGAYGTGWQFNVDGTTDQFANNDDLRIVFEPVREAVTRQLQYVGGEFLDPYDNKYGQSVNITFDLINGTPDWSTAKVTPC